MRKAISRQLALWTFVAVAGCSTPGSPSSADQFAWIFDGQSFAASSNGMGALRGGSNVFLTGVDCRGGAGINMTFAGGLSTTGTVQAGSSLLVTYTPDGRTSASSSVNWTAGSLNRGSGSAVITTLTSTRVAGSFSFVLAPGSTNSETGTRTVSGSFDVAFHDRTIC